MNEHVVIREPLPLTIEQWLSRDIPDPDYVMGNWLSTTSRTLLVAPTGLGKTNFGLALSSHMAAGEDFLHWKGRRPARVLFVDGEMSNRLMLRRLRDAIERLGGRPDWLHILCFDDIENAQPLNSTEGQAIIEEQIERIGGVDFITFDSVMALIGGDMKDEETWRETLPWIRSLTRRSIGQMWVHHTGHDETRSYGTKTREWQMDTVLHLEKDERPDTDVSFNLSFRKARERTPDTRADFQDVKVALVNDVWAHEANVETKVRTRLSPMGQRFLDALSNALATNGVTTFQGWPAVTLDIWKAECVVMGLIDKDAKPASARALFSKYRAELVAHKVVTCNGELAWKT